MDAKEYQAEALRTKSDTFMAPIPDHLLVEAPDNFLSVDVLHALVGISTEAGELLDVAKKSMFYGRAVDYVNLDEEIGDVLWYVAIYCNARRITIEQLMETNVAKLRARFPACFTEAAANNRDLAAERAVLEAQDREMAKRSVAAADAELAKMPTGEPNAFDDRMKPE